MKRSRITPERVLAFTKDVKAMTEVTDKFSMKKLTERHGISSMIPHAMLKGKLIENVGGTSFAASYRWTSTVEPNIKMAERIIEEYRRLADQNKQRTKEKQHENQLSIKVPEDKIQERQIQEINNIHHELSQLKQKVNLLKLSKPKC